MIYPLQLAVTCLVFACVCGNRGRHMLTIQLPGKTVALFTNENQ